VPMSKFLITLSFTVSSFISEAVEIEDERWARWMTAQATMTALRIGVIADKAGVDAYYPRASFIGRGSIRRVALTK
jgi:hypothetical protein